MGGEINSKCFFSQVVFSSRVSKIDIEMRDVIEERKGFNNACRQNESRVIPPREIGLRGAALLR